MDEENDAISSMQRMWRFALPYLRFLPFLRDKRKESLEGKMKFCCEFYTILPLSSSSKDVFSCFLIIGHYKIAKHFEKNSSKSAASTLRLRPHPNAPLEPISTLGGILLLPTPRCVFADCMPHIFHFSMSVWEAILTYYADIIFPKKTENGRRSRNWYYYLALFCRRRCVLFSAYRCLWIFFQGETAYWYDGSTKIIMKKHVQLMFASGTTICRLLHGCGFLLGGFSMCCQLISKRQVLFGVCVFRFDTIGI